MECYRRRQTTDDDDIRLWPPTLCVGGPVIIISRRSNPLSRQKVNAFVTSHVRTAVKFSRGRYTMKSSLEQFAATDFSNRLQRQFHRVTVIVWISSSVRCCWQAEFAEALALKPDSLFVSQMFFVIDRDGNGFISFRELLYAVLLFAKGNSDHPVHRYRHLRCNDRVVR